ncbi:MAG TPA: SDR family oxidoreductase [Solirubrobacterales bacterium]|nr:SDR family oxidoreductase [Solirubrobacterales bacterium]
MAGGLIGVTGATGFLGGRVARLLNGRKIRPRIIVRNAASAPPDINAEVAEAVDYGATKEMEEALVGVETLFLVSGREDKDRLEKHFSAVDAAMAAGVKKIVYTSALGASPLATFTLARQHFATEQYIENTGVDNIVMRNSIYMDYVPYFAGPDGVIRAPANDGRLSAVARDDVADIAAQLLTSNKHDGEVFDVTGPEAFTLAEAAERMTEKTGRKFTFVNESEAEAYQSRAHLGAPDWEVEGWVTSYLAIAGGELDAVVDTVQKVAGHWPMTLEAFLTAHPESWEHVEATA